ncbi:DUF2232 domain-containing protein [Paenibacillus arenosi]|uniref:DUF2232 domain-containing protein n=1 Tax=Paenibacillus arenosi TaxID=2774142 RepID=A0ABR9AUV0_9BACL|nr:DUF2232 domain-containing protein [Paenibacillus arenosi]MBD8497864.1 DUF2232 domain-containing protein [Paenibacillus arenosi]
MNNRWTAIGWVVAALVLLLSFGTLMQPITMSFVAIPFVVLFTTLSTAAFMACIAAVLLIVFLLLQPIGSIVVLISLYFIIPAIVMGYLFKRQRSGWSVFVGGTLAFLIQSLLALGLTSYLFQVDITTYLHEYLTQYQKLAADMGVVMPNMPSVDEQVAYISMRLPSLLIAGAVYMGSITYAISRRLLTAQGVSVQRMKPVKYWMLPKSLLWYYLVAMILELVIVKEAGSFLTLVIVNLYEILQVAFIVQGVSFLFFYADFKGWKRALPVTLTIFVVLFPPFQYICRLVGIIDMAFPLRQAVSRPKQ